jgi:hypothetical protein
MSPLSVPLACHRDRVRTMGGLGEILGKRGPYEASTFGEGHAFSTLDALIPRLESGHRGSLIAPRSTSPSGRSALGRLVTSMRVGGRWRSA